jgi:pectinesterase
LSRLINLNGNFKFVKNTFELVGAGMDKTIISQSIARDAWRCEHEDDWGVATVNLDSCNSINFKNLTDDNINMHL